MSIIILMQYNYLYISMQHIHFTNIEIEYITLMYNIRKLYPYKYYITIYMYQ